MTRSSKYASRLGMVALLCLTLGIGILLASCYNGTSAEQKPVTKAGTKAPATTAKTPEKKAAPDVAKQPAKVAIAQKPILFPAEPQACQNLIELHMLKQSLLQKKDESPASVEKAIKDRWEQLKDKIKPQILNDSVTVVDYRYEQVAEDNYRLLMLFQINRDIDKNCGITSFPQVDSAQRNQLAERDRATGVVNWCISKLEKPTPTWKAGSYELVVDNVKAKPIPYKVVISFRELRPDGTFVPEIWGVSADLGWMADVSQK